MHRRASDLPPAVGVLVEYDGDAEDAARGAAMQIAAMRPQYVSRDEVPADVVAKEREIAEATAREEGKPEQALPKIVEGRLNGFFKEVALLDQPSVAGLQEVGQGGPRRGRRERQALRPLRDRRLTARVDATARSNARRGGRSVRTHHCQGPASSRLSSPTLRRTARDGLRRVLLKLSGEVFGGGRVGVDPTWCDGIAARDRRRRAQRRPGRDRRRRRQLLPRRRAAAERHGPLPGRLHGHARHGDELPGAAGLPREAGRGDPGADRDHDGPGRRALHPASRDPAPREGPRGHLRRRRRDAVLLHRHRRRPARPGDPRPGDPDGQAGRRRRLRRRPATATPTR